MKSLTEFINESIFSKKYTPKDMWELKDAIKELLDKGKTDLNCIDISNITDMTNAFEIEDIDKYDFDVSKWDVSNVKNMYGMFVNCKKFTGKGLENWDVSKVENMQQMFYNCRNFDCDLSRWDTSKVKNMNYMFNHCISFEGKGLENWDVSNVKSMYSMFDNCKKLDCDLSGWKTRKANTSDMFKGCTFLKNTPDWYDE